MTGIEGAPRASDKRIGKKSARTDTPDGLFLGKSADRLLAGALPALQVTDSVRLELVLDAFDQLADLGLDLEP
jgi:hypothetical protein